MTTLNNNSEGLLRWDARTWQVLPSPTSTDDFNSIEVQQLVLQPLEILGRYYLFFSLSVKTDWQRPQPTGQALTHIYYLVANQPEGPFSTPKVLLAAPGVHLSKSKLVQNSEQGWYLNFVGTSLEPLPITVNEKGDLQVFSQVASLNSCSDCFSIPLYQSSFETLNIQTSKCLDEIEDVAS